MNLTRRNALKTSGLALGALALGAVRADAGCDPNQHCTFPDPITANEYTYLPTSNLPIYTPLEDNEMRISFMGSVMPLARLAQAEMSVFVEVGPWVPDPVHPDKPEYGRATDSFVFDCGSGITANYQSMGIAFRKMSKVFINHLHADHMNELGHIYCFGAAGDRHFPLYVWGPGPSGVPDPKSRTVQAKYYSDGTYVFCQHLREMMRWHSESFSFLNTAYHGYPVPDWHTWGTPCPLIPVGDDPNYDGYALIPIELPWRTVGGVAYNNQDTKVKITHYPVIHARQGAVGYKLEWNGLSMIYSSDTKPEWLSVQQACNPDKNGVNQGVDVFIHEMILPPEAWALKMTGFPAPPQSEPQKSIFEAAVQKMKTIEDSSHTPQGAFGFMLSQINPRPRLTVACHFPVANDTVDCALKSVKAHCPDITAVGDKLAWAFDRMVVRVFAGNPKPPIIQQMVAPVSDFSFNPTTVSYLNQYPPKYSYPSGDGNPYAQIDLSTFIPPVDRNGVNYCPDGY